MDGLRPSEDGTLFRLVGWPADVPPERRPVAGLTRVSFGNFVFSDDEPPKAVVGRRQALAARLGVPFERWTSARQVHGNRIAVVDEGDIGRGRVDPATAIDAADGLITRTEALLVLFFADCLPIYLYAPKAGAVGLVHAGWRGTAANVAAEAVRAFATAFGVPPADLYAYLGPGICGRDYEVDEPVAGALRSAYGPEVPGLRPTGSGKYRLDLAETNRFALLEAGIPAHRVEWTRRCTTEPEAGLYSYRRDGRAAGRMAAFIALPPGHRESAPIGPV
ncbi:MAG: hypothetical protein HSCHL_2357 [Hydrogenibacillus schlegelii]|uniref:Purine nucleoside phosphorylase n=1 Tax=Hydrogenibacillus schlegelii TaxID=1484 RepID=A0A2T5GF07_HYDSH|nr:peptidoglycan editing factor PgeF [Hydrogenibacillus schlegelii]PTQ54766.1 MAG: hypothetical protein HSCHL_2357 [Hydrogenibacillus schlegelii]